MNRRRFVRELSAAAGGPLALGVLQRKSHAQTGGAPSSSPPLEPTTITLHSDFQVGAVDPRIFGGFLEHMGRCVYEGIYHPECSCADPDGYRSDVLSALRRLRATVVRWPGGDFASGYHWMNGVGPAGQRPILLDRAWRSIEPNRVGTHEFIQLCRKMNWQPMITANLGTGDPEEAANWFEYCNGARGTKYADLRAAHGHPEPYGVKLWCLGNEMDKPSQQGHLPPQLYAVRAQQASNLIRRMDPSAELLVAGSRGTDEPWYRIPTYLEWDRQVLEIIEDGADYLSIHRYVGNRYNDTADYLAVTNSIDRQIEAADAVCRFVQARRNSRKRIFLSVDEWNVWYRNRTLNGGGRFAPHLAEEVYNLEDALVVAGFFHSFLRHADVVKIAAISMLVNVFAPILTRGNDILLQSIFYPFEMFSKRRKGISLQPVVKGPKYESKVNGEVTYLDVSAILGDGRVHLFATNRHVNRPAPVHFALADRKLMALENAEVLTAPDAKAANSFEKPDIVKSRPFAGAEIESGRSRLTLPPLSMAALTFRVS